MNIAILGFGTVGSGVYDVLNMNRDVIAKRAGEPLDIRYVLDLREFPGQPVMNVLTHNIDDIINDPDVDIIAEVMGGTEPAYTFTKKALMAGKAVCTSNKELVSRHGAELLRIAAEHNVNYRFEASVGGGIPIIRPLCDALTADDILQIRSIVNGTTNYILTRMRDAGLDFDTALSEAQAKGFAERNPAADIEGLDAARKTSILASLAEGMQVDCEEVYAEGITAITAEDIAYAGALNARIRLISLVRRDNGRLFAMVAPFLIRKECQLFNVDGVFNAVQVTGNAVGDVMFYGSGAGKLPTASAVVGDIVDEALHRHTNVPISWSEERRHPEPASALESRFFVRVPAEQAEKARGLFSIAETADIGRADEFAFVTEVMSTAAFEEKAAALDIIGRIRADF